MHLRHLISLIADLKSCLPTRKLFTFRDRLSLLFFPRSISKRKQKTSKQARHTRTQRRGISLHTFFGRGIYGFASTNIERRSESRVWSRLLNVRGLRSAFGTRFRNRQAKQKHDSTQNNFDIRLFYKSLDNWRRTKRFSTSIATPFSWNRLYQYEKNANSFNSWSHEDNFFVNFLNSFLQYEFRAGHRYKRMLSRSRLLRKSRNTK